jgi:stearoyl-CoA desaturase (delta-9 desaturase)
MSNVAAGASALPNGSSPSAKADASSQPAKPSRNASLATAVQPVEHETRDRIITGLLTVVPFLLLGLAAWQVWNEALHWHDLLIFGLIYIPTGFGITVGFHRLFTHRSFKAGPAVRAVFGALGSAAIEGPVISWVADHRKHHAFSDEEGDPHSPHVGHGEGVLAQFKGFFHAHVGWLFIHTQRGNKKRFAPDLLKDPVVRFIDRTFILWALIGLAIPFGLGWAIGGTVVAGLTGLLWGGAVRIFVLHHMTYSINSLCHMFGKRDFETTDESRNLAWLALPTFGEAWHNSHHAFPTSAVHGMKNRQLDPSAAVIWSLEKLGLAWDVVRIPPERQATKAATPVPAS